MHILVVGLNHKTAPVAVREKLAFTPEHRDRALPVLRNTKSVLEGVILSTCNRMEVYAVVDQLHTGEHFIKGFLSEQFNLPKEEFVDYLYVKANDEAVVHLFRVTAGLDSLVLGETQILGQVREAYYAALEAGATGTVFNTLFKQAITLAKRAHAETQINHNAVSVSYAAVELGKKVFGSFAGKRVLIIGAGKMGELTVKHLLANGARQVMVVNRTVEKARELAASYDGEAYGFDALPEVLVRADVVISSTGAPGYVVTKADVAAAMAQRRWRPLFLIDIAVPRDLDPAIAELDNVYLYDIDDLKGVVAANLREREKEARKIEAMIAEELEAFHKWLNTLGVVPLIAALREKALAIQDEAMKRIEKKLPHLSEQELRVIRKQTKSIVNQLLRDPILRIKELAAEPNAEEAKALFATIFALEEALAARQAQETACRRPEADAARGRLPAVEALELPLWP